LNRHAGWFLELWFGKLQRDVGIARRLVETILLNDPPSSLTKISASFQDEFPNRLPRGYGFVELSEGSGDAFLHASVLGRIGISAVRTRAAGTHFSS
jgi:hypothetical protein